MKQMNFLKRLLATTIDKLVILACLVPFIFLFPDFGYYIGIIITNTRPENYTGMQNVSEIDYTGIDISFTIGIALLSILTSLIPELIRGASVGKLIMGGVVVNEQQKRISSVLCCKRAVSYVICITVFIFLRWKLNLSYPMMLVLYYLVVDISIFFSGRSLIDINTGTYVMQRDYGNIVKHGRKDTSRRDKFKYLHLFIIIITALSILFMLSIVESEYHKIEKGMDFINSIKDKYPYYYENEGIAFRELPKQVKDHNIIVPIQQTLKNNLGIKYNTIKMYCEEGISQYDEPHYRVVERKRPIYKQEKRKRPRFYLYGYDSGYETYYYENVLVGYKTYKTKETYYITYPNPWSYSIITCKTDPNNDVIEKFEKELNLQGRQLHGDIWGTGEHFLRTTYQDSTGHVIHFLLQNNEYVYYIKYSMRYIKNTLVDNIIDNNQSKTVKILDMAKIKDIKKTIISYLVILVLNSLILLAIYFVVSTKLIKKELANKQNHYMYLWGVIAWGGNIIIFLIQFYLYGIAGYKNEEALLYTNLFASFLVMDTILIPRLYYCKSSYRFIPGSRFIHICLKNTQERKSFLAFVVYPLYYLGVAPFGIFILFYTIPMILILLIVITIRKLITWINPQTPDDKEKKKITFPFRDYYLLLGLSQNATSNEINTAFNKQMALYNVNPGLFNKQFQYDILESYQVLNSEDRLRPMYDNEYKNYLRQPDPNYIISDYNLIRDIAVIRKQISNGAITINKTPDFSVNIVLLAFFISFIVIACLFPLFL